MCLGNISKDFSSTNAQETGLYGYAYDFSVDYRAIKTSKIHDIHTYFMKKKILYKMFPVVKKILAIIFLVSSINVLKCISMKNQKCKVREVVINNEYMIYPFSIKVNRCNGNCNNINNPYSRVCIPNVVKNITAKVFDLMSWKNKTKQIKWHESCRCVCRLNPIICNNKERWNKDKCRCKCLVNRKCDNNLVWNPSNYKCEYKKKTGHLLTEECEEIIDNENLSTKQNVSIKSIISLCQ